MNLNKWNVFNYNTENINIQNKTISTSLLTFYCTILTQYPKEYYVFFILKARLDTVIFRNISTFQSTTISNTLEAA